MKHYCPFCLSDELKECEANALVSGLFCLKCRASFKLLPECKGMAWQAVVNEMRRINGYPPLTNNEIHIRRLMGLVG